VADAKPPRTPGPFDVGTVRELIELMDKFDLGEVDLNDGDQRIRLRRGGRLVVNVVSIDHLAELRAALSGLGAMPTALHGHADSTNMATQSSGHGTRWLLPAQRINRCPKQQQQKEEARRGGTGIGDLSAPQRAQASFGRV
jgi:hypothetical protein